MIEVISIHIPKAAGRSFYQTLKWAYPEGLDIPRNRDNYFKGIKLDGPMHAFPGNMKVIHGHFFYSDISPVHRRTNAKIVTWLRDPVERVISNYFYNMNMVMQKPQNEKTESRRKFDLITFASKEKRRNVMSRYLRGLDPHGVFFAGFVESFAEDLQLLGKLLGWPAPVPVFHINNGKTFKNEHTFATAYKEITHEMRDTVMGLNQKDMDLYLKFKEIAREKQGNDVIQQK